MNLTNIRLIGSTPAPLHALWMCQRWRLLSLVLVFFSTATPAEGQVVRGHLLEHSTGEAVSGATVTLIMGKQRFSEVFTDDTGFFQLSAPTSGKFSIEASRMGYTTTNAALPEIEGGDTVSVQLLIHPEPIRLDPLLVTGRSGSGRSSFYAHKEDWGKGLFFSPEMVDSINPRHPVDVINGSEGTWISWRPGGRGPLVPRVRTLKGSGCLTIMLNRHPIDPGFWGGLWTNSPLEFLQGRDVVAVEYYRYIGEVPPELLYFAGLEGGMCGLLIFWTRTGW